MKYSRHARMVLAGAAALIVAIVAIGWWMSFPGNITKSGQAIIMLAGTICSMEHWRRFPKGGSPPLLIGAIAGLGVPFLVASAGPMYATVLSVFVLISLTGVGMARAFTSSPTELRRRMRDRRAARGRSRAHGRRELAVGER